MSKLARYSLPQNDLNELFLEEKLSHSNFGKTFSYMRCYSRFSQSEAAVQRYSEKKTNMQQIYRRTPMPKCDFNKVALQHYFATLVCTNF